ncbi:MAG: beta-ribofuranosylaminobenzene 5'-phosphate synthase family protein [Desulfovibrionaceae bacterium]
MKVTVTAQARLHFGFTNLMPELGNVYGSVGVALDAPSTRIIARPAETLTIEGPHAELVARCTSELSAHYGANWKAHLVVERTIDRHSGLGSGTQTALATAAALLHLHGMPCDIREAAGAMGRGLRSGVGIAAFRTGGFILDGGHERLERPEVITPSSVLVRHDFPDDWRFVLYLPSFGPGLSGTSEAAVFRELGDTSASAEAICRMVLLRMLPALVARNITAFGAALTEIDTHTGGFFARAQGGIYRKALADGAVEALLGAGAHGVGQSSWGPCLYALVDDRSEKDVVRAAQAHLDENGLDGKVLVARANNQGADIDIEPE